MENKNNSIENAIIEDEYSDFDDYVEGEGEREKNLTFTIGEEIYGVQIERITQIIGIQQITFVPHQPEYVKGVINLRGQILPVIEIRTKFKKENIEYDDRSCIIVVNKEDVLVGLIVDRISDVYDILKENISPSKDLNNKRKVEYIKGIAHCDETIIKLLDIDKLLENEDFSVSA